MIAGVSAIALFILMFFQWFGVKAVNTSNLLFAVQSVAPGQSAWEALDYIPIVLTATAIVTVAAAAGRFVGALPKPPFPVVWLVPALGLISFSLILFRIVDPPVFAVEQTVTTEGTVLAPIFFALLAAVGIVVGGWLAMQEEAADESGAVLPKARTTISAMRVVDEDFIAEAGRRLAAAAPDAEVILFGSYARGEAGANSDVDFLVVEPEVANEAEESVRLHRTLRDLRVPVDVVVVSREYADRWREVRGGLVHAAMSQGRVLVE